MLHLLPLDLQLKSVTSKSSTRLRESGFLKQMDFGHGAALRDFPGIPEVTDYVTPRLDFSVNYSVKIPDRRAWNGRPGLWESAISVFTNISKIEDGTGEGVNSKGLNLSCLFRLFGNGSVFQAKVLAIFEAAKAIEGREPTRSRIVLYSSGKNYQF